MKTSVVKYQGGPLDGQVAEQRGAGKWSSYRRDDGTYLSTPQGDRIFATGGGQRKRYGYALLEVSGGRRDYVHASLA